jgi:alpha-tubulin suppressor-like RCC1 family protein
MRPSALSSGGHFSYAVSERDGGAVYRWGTDNGRVYLNPTPVALPESALNVFGGGGRKRRAVAVACGGKHTLILLEGGLVLGCGVGYFGQLGRGDDASSHEPRLIEALSPGKLDGGSGSGSGSFGSSTSSSSSSSSGSGSGGSNGSGEDRVVGVAAGGCHSGCYTKAGDVYMWGFNRSGQCGVGPDKSSSSSKKSSSASNNATAVPFPRKLEGLAEASGSSATAAAGAGLKVVQLVCGRHHSACLTSSGAVYSWGATSFGRLGIHDLSVTVFCLF